jgi:hypothetical protein
MTLASLEISAANSEIMIAPSSAESSGDDLKDERIRKRSTSEIATCINANIDIVARTLLGQGPPLEPASNPTVIQHIPFLTRYNDGYGLRTFLG